MNAVDKSGRKTEKEKKGHIESEGKEGERKIVSNFKKIHFAYVMSTGSSDRFIDQLLTHYACK